MQLKSDKPCGVVYIEAGTHLYLPLEWTEVHADIIDGAYPFHARQRTVANDSLQSLRS